MTMSFGMIIFLLVLGLLLLVLELLILPGGIAGIIAIGIMAFSVFMSYRQFGTETGHIFLLSTLASTGIILFFALRSGFWDRISQKETLTGKTNLLSDDIKPGDKGITLSALRPSGNAIINDKRMEVQSRGEIIEGNAEIEIINIKDNKIIVKKVNS